MAFLFIVWCYGWNTIFDCIYASVFMTILVKT